jgi:phage terminase small subunit
MHNNGENRPLTVKQQRFVEEYCIDWNAARAARDAGYSQDSAKQIAHELLTNPYLQQAIEARKVEIAAHVGISQEWAIGRLRDMVETCGQKIPVKGEDGVTKYVDSAGLGKSLEMVGKHTGIFEADNSQKDGGLSINIVQLGTNGNDNKGLASSGTATIVQDDSPTPCIEGKQAVIEGKLAPTEEDDQ